MGDAHGQALSKTMRHHQWWKGACVWNPADTTVTNREFKAFVDATGYTGFGRNRQEFVCLPMVEPEEEQSTLMYQSYAMVASSARCLLESSTGRSLQSEERNGPSCVVRFACISLLRLGKVKLPTETQWEYAAWRVQPHSSMGRWARTRQLISCQYLAGRFSNTNESRRLFRNSACKEFWTKRMLGIYQMIGSNTGGAASSRHSAWRNQKTHRQSNRIRICDSRRLLLMPLFILQRGHRVHVAHCGDSTSRPSWISMRPESCGGR